MAEIKYAELRHQTRDRWYKLSSSNQDRIRMLPFVQKITDHKIYFVPGYKSHEIEEPLNRELKKITRRAQFTFHYADKSPEERLTIALKTKDAFKHFNLGSDVAEQDQGLLHYFISTPAYRRVMSKEKSVIIGPKGSGKSAILRCLSEKQGAGYCVVITPEVFATSVLSQFVEGGSNVWGEDEAFVSTWIFTILIEVLKRVSSNPKGIKAKDLRQIRTFLSDNAQYEEVDLFTRFISYLKKIEGVKLGNYEITLKQTS